MPPSACLIVDGPDRRVATHPLDPQIVFTIGRNDSCEIVLRDPGVSGSHAEVRHDGKQWLVRDLDSRNGTRLNNKKLVDEQPLRDGDVVLIKPFSLMVKVSAPVLPERALSGISINDLLKARENDPERMKSIKQLTALLERRAQIPAIMAPALKDAPSGPEVPTTLLVTRKEHEALELAHAQASLNVQLLRQVTMAPDEDSCFRDLLDTCAMVLKAQVAFVMIINPENKGWDVRAQTKAYDEIAQKASGEQRAPFSLGIVTRAIKLRKPLVASDLDEDESRPSASMARNDIATCIAAPILEGEETIGCLYFDRRERATEEYYNSDAAGVAGMMASVFAEAAQCFMLRRVLAARVAKP